MLAQQPLTSPYSSACASVSKSCIGTPRQKRTIRHWVVDRPPNCDQARTQGAEASFTCQFADGIVRCQLAAVGKRLPGRNRTSTHIRDAREDGTPLNTSGGPWVSVRNNANRSAPPDKHMRQLDGGGWRGDTDTGDLVTLHPFRTLSFLPTAVPRLTSSLTKSPTPTVASP